MNDIPVLSPSRAGKGTLFHCDASQVIGKVPFACKDVDLASVSSHKIYGPQGVGALYVQRRPRIRLAPLFSGGGQERGLRSGTLPVALIAGFGLACALCLTHMATEASRLAALRDALSEWLTGALAAKRHEWPGCCEDYQVRFEYLPQKWPRSTGFNGINAGISLFKRIRVYVR